MTPTSEVVARLTAERDRHVIGYPGPRRDVAELLDNALALISSLVAERDAGAETALRIAGKYADAVDRVEALTNRALNAERLLAEARATLRDAATALDHAGYPKAADLARAALSEGEP